jgi:hypothetical protein
MFTINRPSCPLSLRSCSLLLAALVLMHAQGASAASQFRLSSGAPYTTGDYGTDTTMKVWHMPITAQYTNGPLSARATVPYMQITRRTSEASHSASGVGDILTSLRLRLFRQGRWHPEVAITGQVSFPTADDDLGLPDENVYYGQIDLGKSLGARFYLFGSVGYQTRKDNDDDEDASWYDERYYGSVGLDYRFTARTSGGLIFSARQPWTAQAADQSTGQMLIPYLSNRLSEHWRLQTHAIAGLSSASPDWGGGMSLSYTF